MHELAKKKQDTKKCLILFWRVPAVYLILFKVKLLLEDLRQKQIKNVLYEIFEEAIKNGDLDKPKYGFYKVTPKYEESYTEMPLEK